MDGILARIRRRNFRDGDRHANLPTRHPDRRGSSAFPPEADKDRRNPNMWHAPRSFSSVGLAGVILGLALVVLTTMMVFMSMPVALKHAARPVRKILRTYIRPHLRTVHPDTYTHYCQHNLMNNDAWGRLAAPYEDKLRVKDLVKSMLRAEGRENLVKIAPTLAHYDIHNISLFTLDAMQSFPQPYLLKPTHYTGGVARVMDDTYECIKGCKFDNEKPFSPLKNGFDPALKNINYNLHHRYDTSGSHYMYIPQQLMIEAHLPMDGLREFQWFTVNGHPVFGRCRCYTNTHKNNSFFTTEFHDLPGVQIPILQTIGKGRCENLVKPGAYSQMMDALHLFGRQFPGTINRIDLYVNDVDVYFGEFTLTTAACDVYLKPVVADRLLHAMLVGGISPSQVTPQFVERLINETPWFCVTLDKKTHRLTQEGIAAFSSEKDLCDNTDARVTCMEACKDVKSFPLRCILVEDEDVTALGQDNLPWMSTLIRGLDIPFALGMATVLGMMIYLNRGGKPGSPIRSNACFLLAVTAYNYLKAHCKSLVSSPLSLLLRTVPRTFSAFVLVHPLENKVLALAHYATYWMAIAAWRDKTPRRMLVWWLLYKVLALGFTESLHQHLEEYDDIRCARMSFRHIMEHYAFDETIRQYIVTPFFVYGYYLPKQISCWLGLVDCGPSESAFQTYLTI